jgi:molecular chaperone DnaK
MNRATIDFGIDLGTTNSEIAVLEGTKATIIKNNDNMDNTPSAVWIDKNNRLSVGRVAKQRIEMEPEDAFSEFKLQMGTQAEYRFGRSGRVMHPEELSAEVLKSLLGDVQQRLSEEVKAAVITVPAAFELPQCNATRRAAELAGLKVSPLIMEPTAAAMAHAFQSRADRVFWLVYDLGGGTFDAAVIQIREGTFRIVNHAGDNHLGGKLVDWEIVEKLLAPAAANEHPLANFSRSNPKWRKAFAKLKWEAEEAKVHLSKDESYSIVIDYLCNDDNGETVPFEYELKRQDVARLAAPFIQRTVNISRQALQQAHLGANDIEKIILVGGPTMAPYVREHLEDAREGLGIRLDFSVDPLTVVAQGAAIFAGTQRLEGGEPSATVSADVYQLELEYEPVGADAEPMVGGRVIAHPGDNLSTFTIEFINAESRPAWRSGKVSIAANGAFMANLWAQRGRPNLFQIELCDGAGKIHTTTPYGIKYTMGIAPTQPPLIHSLGVALANNDVSLFMEKGVTLPKRQRKDLRSAVPVHRNMSGESIHIPVVEGDNARADRNRLIGYLEIKAEEVKRDLPADTEVEVTLQIDESRIVTCSAYIPLLDQEFETVLKLEKIKPNVSHLEKELEQEKARLQEARTKAQNTGDADAQKIIDQRIDGEQMVQNVETSLSAARGDPDAGDKAQNRLLDVKIAIDEVEDALEWPALVVESGEQVKAAHEIIDEYGDKDAKVRFAQLLSENRKAIQGRDVDQVRHNVSEIASLMYRVCFEQPSFWTALFENLQKEKAKMRDRNQAEQLIIQGNRAIQGNDLPRLKATVQQMFALLPEEQRQQIQGGFGSGVVM